MGTIFAKLLQEHKYAYRTRAIISRGLYIFYPISKNHFFVFKEVFSKNSVLMYGLYSRAAWWRTYGIIKTIQMLDFQEV